MTLYILTDGVDEFERSTLGIFSSLERLERVKSIFDVYGGCHGELMYEEFEPDALENILSVIEKDLSDEMRVYRLSRYVQNPNYPPNWNVYLMVPYEYRYEKDEVIAFRISGPLFQSATIRAKSEDEAIEIAERMLKEQAA